VKGRLALSIALLLVVLALLFGVVRFDPWEWFAENDPANDATATEPRDSAPANQDPAGDPPPAEEDHTVAFKDFIMIDREREPDWLPRLSRVVFTGTGALVAETTLPADWRDATTRTRPAESICTQLFAYVQRGAKREWKGVSVLASDGSALVDRKDVAGSCKQA
jgi:hypothetical protein